jgi:hypothetical protein
VRTRHADGRAHAAQRDSHDDAGQKIAHQDLPWGCCIVVGDVFTPAHPSPFYSTPPIFRGLPASAAIGAKMPTGSAEVTLFPFGREFTRRLMAISGQAVADLITARRSFSKIGRAQFVMIFLAANIQLRRDGTYLIAVGVKRVQEAGFVKAKTWLNSRQRIFIDKERRFYRAVISPKSHGMPRRIV